MIEGFPPGDALPGADFHEVVQEARSRGIHLWTEGNRLRFKAPGGGLPADLRSRLADSRDEVIAALQREAEQTTRLEPMAENQVGIWYAQRLTPGSNAYNLGIAHTVRDGVDATTLVEAMQILTDRHDVLRTDYPEADGVPLRRVVGRTPATTIESAVAEGEALAATLRRLTSVPFTLDGGPTFRIHRVTTDAEDVVLFVAHHLSLDGLSIRLLAREMMAVYIAIASGNAPPLKDSVDASYREWVDAQQGWLHSSGEAASRYWANVLTPPPPSLAIPLDRPASPTPVPRGATCTRHCSPDVSSRLRELCRGHGSSPFVGMLAAYMAFLRALTGEDDITVGTPVHGRTAARFATTLGHLVNSVPLRVRGTGEESLLDLMDRLRDTLREAAPFQNYPLPRITWEAQAAHGTTPVRTLFALHDFRRFAAFRDETEDEGSGLREIPFDQLEGQFNLSLDVYYEHGRYRCAWRYDATTLDEATVDGWAEIFDHFLNDVVSRPSDVIGEVGPRPTSDEVVLHGRRSDLDAPSPCEAVELHAARTPNAPAVEAPNGAYSYSQLLDAARAMTAALRDLGVEPGDRVAVMVERSRELVAVLLGIHGCGAAYVPIDPRHPSPRIRAIITDSGPTALVSHRGLHDGLVSGLPVLDLDHLDAGAVVDFTPTSPESAAYATYTSGSTGTPKAVVVPHRAMANFLASMAVEPGISASDSLLAVTTIAFDISVLELFLPLTVGARVVVASEAEATDGRLLARRLIESGITVMQATPASWKLLLLADWTGKRDMRALCGGEALPPDLAEELQHRVGELWNMYGPTETTVWSTVHRIEGAGPILIGHPIANTSVQVLNPFLRPVPVGFAGELYLGGAGVATGYLARPDLTSERFVPDANTPGERMYRTGDRVRLRHDGLLQHLGRTDDQIKVRGFRIEVGEIEAVLRQHPAVRDAAAATRPGHGGESLLVAWIVATGRDAVDVGSLRTHLGARLPDYMIPSAWGFVPEIPLTANGKIDRNSLPALEASGTSSLADSGSGGPAPARNAEEEVLVEIFQHALRSDRIGIHDNFFAIGGQSLLATMITARVRSVLGVELPLRQFFAMPTIAGVADWVRSSTRPARERPPIGRLEPNDPARLSFSQERMWFLQQLSPEDISYNLAAATVVDGVFDRDRLIRALRTLEERHSILRTRIVAAQGRPVQLTVPSGGFAVTTQDLTDLVPAEAHHAAVAFATQYLYAPYDLAKDPPLRLAIIQLEEDRDLLALGMHHVVGDQGSFEILIAELSELYLLGPESQGLAPLPVSYADFASWQRALFTGNALNESLTYWMGRLDGLSPVELPTDRPRPPIVSHAGRRVTRPIPAKTVEALAALGVATQATPFILLLAAYTVLLYARTRQTDLPVGVPTAHRDHPALEGLIGSFVNTLVHRNDLSGNPTFREIVARVRETALDAFSHQDLPFSLLVREMNPDRDQARTPLFQVMFNLDNARVGTGGFQGLSAEALQLPYPAAQFDVTMMAELNERRREFHLSYRSDLFDETTAEAMIDHYADIVDRALADPDVALADLASAPPEERWLLLDEWNRTEWPTAESSEAGVLAALSEHAARHPDRVAVTGPSGSFSYQELLDATAEVTARLRAASVGQGDRVAIAMERGRDLIAGLLGIWGAGAAYVPMDPGYPEARLHMMLNDSGAVAILTHRGLAALFGTAVPVVDLDTPSPSTTTTEPAAFDPARTAYLIYTSGSTGGPKAVEVPHGAVVNFLRSMAREPGLTEDDSILAVTTISFDISVLELFLPLLVGGRVVVAGDEEAGDGRKLVAHLADSDITVMQATPSTWKLLIMAGWEGHPGLKVLSGGEALSQELAGALRRRCGDLWNMYGPTETTVWSSASRVVDDGPVSIGRPIANTTLYVLDDQMQPVPIGVPGELFIGGHGVATGYFGRPQLTAERFVPDPFRPEGRLYKTGDRVRYRRDGQLEHMGRLDQQVKVRGHRVELLEVEAVLRLHTGVDDVVVVARDDRLVAYIQHAPLAAATSAELRSWMADRVPAFMVPSLFTPLDAFPLTPNGKVDRARLPKPRARREQVMEVVQPSGAMETAIAEVWRDLIGVDEVGANDNFFELGGHSLLAMEAVALVRERMGIELDPREFFFKSLRQIGNTGSRSNE